MTKNDGETESPQDEEAQSTQETEQGENAGDTEQESEATASEEETATDEQDSEESEASSEDQVEQFFDPNKVPPELKGAFKAMQASFTRRMQDISSQKEKIALFDKIQTDPENAIRLLADRVGLKVSKEGEVTDSGKESKEDTDTTKYIRRLIKEELGPALEDFKREAQSIKAKENIDFLNENHPDWYLYEDLMVEQLQKHPSLKGDPTALYDAAKAAASRLGKTGSGNGKKAVAKQTKVSTKPSVSSAASTTGVKKASSIDEAFNNALKQIGVGG